MTQFPNFPPSPVQIITHPLLTEKQITLSVKRDDLLHPQLQGNKWRKLEYNIAYFIENRNDFANTILTFGGAHSNHIYATAAAGKYFGIKTIGVIRGERTEPLNATLAFAEESGMHLHYIDRSTYRQRGTTELSAFLQQKFGAFYEIPEGGSNDFAVQGVAELARDLPECDCVAVAAGTGATAAGLVLGATLYAKNYRTLAFSALKGGGFLRTDIQNFVENATQKLPNFDENSKTDFNEKFELFTEFHAGGYAKTNDDLRNFIADFIEKTNIPIEFVYTGKLFYGLFALIANDYFTPKTNIIAIHTGGLR
jgi:1-aminocyclopropane-1-carboxylate deaminase